MEEKKRTLIACSMLEDELNVQFQRLDFKYPVIWLDRGYHNSPEKLKDKLQEIIFTLQDQDEILLAFGLCGNGTAGLYSPNTRLIIPKFDDCLNMLLCSKSRTTRAFTESGTIYLTRGWTLDQESIIQQYEALQEKYDKETCEVVMDMMYAHYDSITLINTGCYDMNTVGEYAGQVCDLLDFSLKQTEGSLHILEQLLSGHWDENFIIVEPGTSILDQDFEFNDI